MLISILVWSEKKRIIGQSGENYEDLLQVGSIGLLRAIERFSLDKGNAFSSFASPYIRGEIQHYLRDRSTTVRIPRRWLELRKLSTRFVQSFREQYHRQPSDREIAEHLDISLAEWQELNLAYRNRAPISLDTPILSDSHESTSIGDLVVDPQYRSFHLAFEDQVRLQQALGQLEDRTRKVLEFVFLQDLTQKEVASLLGVSVITVSRRVKNGLTSLKKIMGS